MIQGRAGGHAHPGRKISRYVFNRLIQPALQIAVVFFHRLAVIQGKREQSDLSQHGAWSARDDFRLPAVALETDSNFTEPNKIEMVRNFALPENSLTRLHPDEVKPVPQVIDNLAVFLRLDSAEKVCILQGQIQGALTVIVFKSLALAGEPHESIEHIAANFPDLAPFQSNYPGGPW